jgi:hypothetical protein
MPFGALTLEPQPCIVELADLCVSMPALRGLINMTVR